LYHKELPTTDNASAELLKEWRIEDDENEENDKDNEDDKYNRGTLKSDNLIKLHVLADKYGVERLKTDTMNGLFMHMRSSDVSLPYQISICHAYKHLPEKSALLNILVDMQCRIAVKCWAELDIQEFPSSFLVSVLERFSRSADDELDVWDVLELCDYHEHKNKDERKVCPHKDVFM
jgi:hypothetical protein